MKNLILTCFVSLYASLAAVPQAAGQERGHLAASAQSGHAKAAAPAFVRVQLVGDNARAPQRATATQKPMSVGAIWIAALIMVIYVSVPAGIVLLLLPRNRSTADDEPKSMPPRKKMKKPGDRGDHPLHAWLWPQPRHA
ncbi:hypothetical protein [Prosthecobacter vanneervenii]|uniref:Uncharacterized protein n=1 Tax=Prosthecobacter vanneervenii TaxID=48466 RepID=A0A7W7Y8B0_9BACT|nr:hypothetical protein [Prosthecobacter vanneervenii]MBB5031483.1 hypothetical protein [Prosthecobacter vanneervenii]